MHVTFKVRSLSLSLPFGLGGVQLDASEPEVRAAWHLYVEFATRITGLPQASGGGSPREALDSLYSLFATTRVVLRDAGPEIATGPESLGPLAIRILNEGIRPFLVNWHSRLPGSDSAPPADWDDSRQTEFDRELDELRRQLAQYVDALAEIAGIRGS